MTILVGRLRSTKCFRAACIRGPKGFLLLFHRTDQDKIMNFPYIHDEVQLWMEIQLANQGRMSRLKNTVTVNQASYSIIFSNTIILKNAYVKVFFQQLLTFLKAKLNDEWAFYDFLSSIDHMKHIRNNLVYPVLMTALLVEQILTSLDRTVSQNSCTVSFLIFW